MDRKWDKSKPPLGPFALNKDSLQAQGLSAWWPLNDGGSTQFDLVGGAHGSGALSNRTLGADGQPAVKLNGTSEYISVGAGKFPFLKTSAFCLPGLLPHPLRKVLFVIGKLGQPQGGSGLQILAASTVLAFTTLTVQTGVRGKVET